MPHASDVQSSDFIFDQLDPKEFISVKGARMHNLKNLDIAIPRNKLVVFTGLSGSGKSSLAFDTIFAEGQRVYVESLNSYARQFLARMEKPDVDYIKGISPAVAIEQKVTTRNPRSTVGTTTEIYDYLKLFFSRIGKTFSPVSGEMVKKDSVDDVVNYVSNHQAGQRILLKTTLTIPNHKDNSFLDLLLQKGFSRVVFNQEIKNIDELISENTKFKVNDHLFLLVDRFVVPENGKDSGFLSRVADSVQTALIEGNGECWVEAIGLNEKQFSNRFERDGIVFEEPSVNFFSFNNPYGACKTCEGFGTVIGIDENLVFPDKNLSVYEGCIAPWKSEKMSEWLTPLLKNGIKFDFPIHRAYNDLNDQEKQLLWDGNKFFKGLNDFFKYIESQSFKIQYRVLLSRYKGRTVCPDCRGTKLRKDASYVKIEGLCLQDLMLMPLSECLNWFNNLKLGDHELAVSQRLLVEIKNRLSFIVDVGLGYLNLNRGTATLSGGEYQRIRLATALGSSLVGSINILDEPSIGLHPKDTTRLVKVLQQLRDLGNTVIVVEHEEEVIKAADQVVDIGPEAGLKGGHLVFQLNHDEIFSGEKNQELVEKSYTYQHLRHDSKPLLENRNLVSRDWIEVKGARENNLKNLNVKIPINTLCAISGVSGSGKSTLIKKIVYPGIQKSIGGYHEEFTGQFDSIKVPHNKIKKVEFVDQNPIGKSTRSNPITFLKGYDHIRSLFASQELAKQRGYTPAYFSFNVEGGRCETCQGEGYIKVEMQFMADIHLLCDECKGKRFKKETLEVQFKNKDISDVLNMTVKEALSFFSGQKKITEKLTTLCDVGLDYIKLGQSSDTLSGGESQRVKLAYYIGKGAVEFATNTLFIFDEPTTGLHSHDVSKLMQSLRTLVNQGNTVIVIEHNLDVIASSDWVIDLGPDAGDKGGEIVFEGTPQQMISSSNTFTANFLKEKYTA
ncbi:MAG: excinuclease ABC subunit UvrA [Cytophagales bacterium]